MNETERKIADLERLVRDLSAQVDTLTRDKHEISQYVPRGVTYTLTSPGSVDPGHVHIFPETKRISYTTYFESFDGWDLSATAPTARLGGAHFQTSTTINTEVGADNEQGISDIDWSKDSGFQTSLYFSATTNQLAYFGLGPLWYGDGTEEGYGFKVSNSTLYAIATEAGVENTVDISSGVTLTNVNSFKAVKEMGAIAYYVNGIKRATISSGLPTGTNPVILSFFIKNTAAENKSMFVAHATSTRTI